MGRPRKPAVLEARHRLAIAGRVTADGRPVAAAEVTITKAPEAFELWCQARAVGHGAELGRDTPDRTETGPDGHFRFLDLPTGGYTLSAALPALGGRYGTAQVSVRVRQSPSAVVPAELALPATAVEGTVRGQGSEPVALAEVRIAGGGPVTRTDLQGRYKFAGIEPGERRIRASALGLEAEERTATVQAGATSTMDFRLGPTKTGTAEGRGR